MSLRLVFFWICFTTKKPTSNAEKMKEWRLQKIENNKVKNKAYYKRNRERTIKQVQERVTQKQQAVVTKQEAHQANSRRERQQEQISAKEKEKIRQQTRERVKRFLKKQREENRGLLPSTIEIEAGPSTPQQTPFSNRMAKKQALAKLFLRPLKRKRSC